MSAGSYTENTLNELRAELALKPEGAAASTPTMMQYSNNWQLPGLETGYSLAVSMV